MASSVSASHQRFDQIEINFSEKEGNMSGQSFFFFEKTKEEMKRKGAQAYLVSLKSLTVMEYLNGKGKLLKKTKKKKRNNQEKNRPSYGLLSEKIVLVLAKKSFSFFLSIFFSDIVFM